jgi:hypothetical protein
VETLTPVEKCFAFHGARWLSPAAKEFADRIYKINRIEGEATDCRDYRFGGVR